MPSFLTFTVSAPLGAMGELAVGEIRDGRARPARSALLGLVAACLGLDRADEAAHAALEAGYGLATATHPGGRPLLDYHTAQVPPRQRGVRHATRREELAAKELNTILSRREYRGDLLAHVALWPRREGARWPLETLAEALRKPVFIPYLGRKSCPLDRPMAPRIHEAPDPRAALAEAADTAAERMWLASAKARRPDAPEVAMDAADARAFGLPILRIERRRDALASRARWQFDLREEAILR